MCLVFICSPVCQPVFPKILQSSTITNMNKSSSQLQMPLGKMYFRVLGGSKDSLVGGPQDSSLESEQTMCARLWSSEQTSHRPHQVPTLRVHLACDF